MLLSMTGYGTTKVSIGTTDYTLQIRTLNSKSLDLVIKLPSSLRNQEATIREYCQTKLERGKVEVMILLEKKKNNTSLSEEYLVQQYKELERIVHTHQLDIKLLKTVLQLPFPTDTNVQEELQPEEWQIVWQAFQDTVEQVQVFRNQEGQSLYNYLLNCNTQLSTLLETVKLADKNRLVLIKEKLQQALQKLTLDHDNNRLEQEMIFYVEKLDIQEEIHRLTQHISFFTKTLQEGKAIGKKLGFISQEMGREVNTIGSKANDYGIQHLVVAMKEEVEKIKEQAFNVL